MEKACKILTFLSAVLLWTCVSDLQTVAPLTGLSITIQNDSGTLLDGVDVFIFDNQVAFNQTVSSRTPTGFVKSTRSAKGNAQFDQLADNVLYFIYATYKDLAKIPGTYITYDNAEEKFSLKNKLTAGSLSSLLIVLKPSDGLITFWTDASNSAVLPISIFSGTAPVGSITQPLPSAPAAFSAGSGTVRAGKGVLTIEGKSGSGCVWVKTLNIIPGQNTTYQLETCGVGSIAFFTDATNISRLPITLQLNANDALPAMTSVVSAGIPSCGAANTITVFRVPGTYTYQANSVSGNCVWTGSFILAVNSCALVSIATCP